MCCAGLTLLTGRASQSLENWEFQVNRLSWEISSPLAHKAQCFLGKIIGFYVLLRVWVYSHSLCGYLVIAQIFDDF